MVRQNHRLNGHEFEQIPEDSEGWMGKPGMLQSMRLLRVGHDLATEQQKQPMLDIKVVSLSVSGPRHGVRFEARTSHEQTRDFFVMVTALLSFTPHSSGHSLRVGPNYFCT